MTCEYVRERYDVPACIGRRVAVNGDAGVIAEDRGHYIGVLFDDCPPGMIVNVHPTWKVEYKDMGPVRQMTRSQKRYKEFQEADWYTGSFAEWLGIKNCNGKQGTV